MTHEVNRDMGSIPPELLEARAEKEFSALIEGLDSTTKETDGFRKILSDAEENEDYRVALAQMRTFLDKRKGSLDRVQLSWSNPELEIDPEGIEQMVREMRAAISNPDAFLGNGSVAEVYTLSRPGSNLCLKWITDYRRYAEGVPTSKEVQFLDTLRDLEISGVRAPKPFFAFSTLRMDGIVMEQLDAVNFRRVIEGQTTEGIPDVLPPEFDLHGYFSKLEAYVRAMHSRGIYHGDLHLRNMMIDRKTGLPYIIDFGKGRFESEQDKSIAHPTDYAANDLETLRLAKIEAKRWLLEQEKKQASNVA